VNWFQAIVSRAHQRAEDLGLVKKGHAAFQLCYRRLDLSEWLGEALCGATPRDLGTGRGRCECPRCASWHGRQLRQGRCMRLASSDGCGCAKAASCKCLGITAAGGTASSSDCRRGAALQARRFFATPRPVPPLTSRSAGAPRSGTGESLRSRRGCTSGTQEITAKGRPQCRRVTALHGNASKTLPRWRPDSARARLHCPEVP
jgi:hypothetical protein